MPIDYSILQVERELDEFQFSLEQIDMEEVKEDTLRSVAMVLQSYVIQQLRAESKITKGSESEYEEGPGPSMFSRDAWLIQKDSDSRYRLRPHPQVEQRAFVLNRGWGEITPNSADYMRFTVDGVPVYRESVPGPDRTQYWQQAFRKLEESGEFERVASNRLQREIEEHI